MPVLRRLRERFEEERPLEDVAVAACLHVTAETANFMLTLIAGGASVGLCSANPLSTQDEVASALGADVEEGATAAKAFVEPPGWGGPAIWFNGGNESTAGPAWLHLDLRSLTGMDAEVERLIGLGASVVRRGEGLTVLADPEGNQFCVEPGPDDP